MQVVILCGGLGTRLREETEYRPKPMVPVGGRPMLWHIMKLYAHYGHKDFILCLGYKGDVIKDYFRNYNWNTSDVTLTLGQNPKIRYHNTHEEEDWTVTLLDTGQETQTGGRLKQALEHVRDDTFLMTYGDGVSDHDINASIEFHQQHDSLATVTAVQPSGRFGELAMDGDTITAFKEKPERESIYISGGFFVFEKSVGNYLKGDNCILEKQPMEEITSSGQLRAFKHHGFWQCMDTYREQQMLDGMWNAGNAPWKKW
ncbi:MAG: glucose-1-phosphate cytidylyltransferase [Limisphaerales bacterium]|jgi:glucose-1-phosphate cytidylyltransferase